MKISHQFKNFKIEGEGQDNFILTNGIGGYVSLSHANISKFQGVYFSKGFDTFKVIEDFGILGDVTSIKNNFSSIERHRDSTVETFFMPRKNALVYELNSAKDIEISLDCRKFLDFRKWGREYSISEKEGKIVVKYTKKTDGREDSSEGKKEYEIYLVIAPDKKDYRVIDKWENKFYSYDSERRSISEMYVYRALRINAKTIVASFSTNLDEAFEEAGNVLKNLKKLKEERADELGSIKKRYIADEKVRMAHICAQNSLNCLTTRMGAINGIFAGFYWFNQFWARDQAVCLKALMIKKDYAAAKEILFTMLQLIDAEGRLQNRIPATGLASADAAGWIFKRVDEFIEGILKTRNPKKYMDDRDFIFVKHALENAIFNIIKTHSKDGLIACGKKETWMDTLQRDGERIEIQALQLCMCKLMKKLSRISRDNAGYSLAHQLESDLLKKTRGKFWNGHYLKDGAEDRSIRPNVFIAYYVYPELLSKKEWVACFDSILPRLWLEFGLSSLDRHSTDFQSRHTGENDLSYHGGDSWYWINNLAAICLWRVGKFRYAKYIQKILHGSTRDILWHGIPGCASEISSAEEQRAFGCFDQAWSASTYIELIDELF